QNLQAKIDSRLDSANPTSLIGLNPFEQKKLEHYNINVGNKFNTETRGINFLVERTSAGMKIVDASRVGKVSYTGQIPIKKTNMFSKVSMNQKSHMGHDHAHLPYEWTFGLGTQDKIVRGMVQNEENVLVGLNAFEQSLLREYDIQPGNTFQTTIAGHPFLIEKTTSGIKVVDHADAQNVAMAPHNHENM
ncbi:MAG: hypothetical protein ACI9UO_002655, partial [Nitrospinales bacterium]